LGQGDSGWLSGVDQIKVPPDSKPPATQSGRRRSRKTECADREVYRSRAEADVFDYIKRFYSVRRRRSTLGYVDPMRFERQVQLA
jgi:transposase InsO family protein